MSGLPHGSASVQKNFWTRIPLSVRVLGGVALGIIVGSALSAPAHEYGAWLKFLSSYKPKSALFLEDLGNFSKLFIDLLKALATPLIFFAVIDALVRTHIHPKKGFKLLCISAINAFVAIVIGLGLANALHGGDSWRNSLDKIKQSVNATSHGGADKQEKKLAAELQKAKEVKTGFVAQAEKYVPKNFIDLFQSNNIISVVLVAILAGAALRKLRKHSPPEMMNGVIVLEDGAQAMYRCFATILSWIIEVIPFAIFGVVASVVGDTGFELFRNLGYYLGIIMLGLFIHAFVYYSFLLTVVARRSPMWFYKGAGEAIATAMSCGSSLATLPVTLRCLKEKLKISDANARLAACVGTNLNHDGIILYEAATTIFIAQALGIPMDVGTQVTVAFASIMAGVGIAGVPKAGLITLTLVLTAGGIEPNLILKVVPILFTVDWIIGRGRATVNVISDMTVATLLERLDPEPDMVLDGPSKSALEKMDVVEDVVK